MDRLQATLHRLVFSTIVFPTLSFALLLGCGGSDTPAPNDASVPPASSPGNSGALDEEPSKPLTEGLMLPDDVAIPKDPPASDGDKSKGMQLPDDLQPSASRRETSDKSGVRLVSTAAAEIKTDIHFATWSDIQSEIKKTGQITVVDFWSLSCTPCLREYPQLVALQNQYPKRVRAVGVNVDFDGRAAYPAQSYESRIAKFLTTVKATFPNYIAESPSEEVFEAVEIASLPAVLVYDGEGELVARFSDVTHEGGFSYEHDIHPLVKKLLMK
jgi:thiol-disulfide isomerase/thioredoxin